MFTVCNSWAQKRRPEHRRAKANNCACLQLAQYLAALAALHVLDYGEVQRHLDSATGQRLLVLGREYHTSTQTCMMWKFRRYWCSSMPHTTSHCPDTWFCALSSMVAACLGRYCTCRTVHSIYCGPPAASASYASPCFVRPVVCGGCSDTSPGPVSRHFTHLTPALSRYFTDLQLGTAAVPPALDCERLDLIFIWGRLHAQGSKMGGYYTIQTLLHPDMVRCSIAEAPEKRQNLEPKHPV